jgi:plasmid stabilization system protein ParE
VRDPLPVTVTRRAEREIKRAAKWWRENREAAADALRDELENAFRLIAAQPHIGAMATNAKLPGVRRVHLSRVHYYLYYRLRPDQTVVEVLALWHTRRGRAPRV